MCNFFFCEYTAKRPVKLRDGVSEPLCPTPSNTNTSYTCDKEPFYCRSRIKFIITLQNGRLGGPRPHCAQPNILISTSDKEPCYVQIMQNRSLFFCEEQKKSIITI